MLAQTQRVARQHFADWERPGIASSYANGCIETMRVQLTAGRSGAKAEFHQPRLKGRALLVGA